MFATFSVYFVYDFYTIIIETSRKTKETGQL